MDNSQLTNAPMFDRQQGMYPDQPDRQLNPLANYQFSPDEIRVLKECNTEAFFQRSLPFGTGFGVAAYFGVKHGYLKPNLSYGAIPKVVTSVIVGYFLGKFSYQQKCAEKIMRLPNSKLGEALRLRKSGVMGTLTADQGFGTGFALSPFMPNSSDVYSDERTKSSSFNLDTDRPLQPGLDDIYRPSLDNPTPQIQTDLPIEPLKEKTSYEELRKLNREEYSKRNQSTFSRPLPPESPIIIRSNEKQPTQIDDFETIPKGRKNKYGDAWSN